MNGVEKARPGRYLLARLIIGLLWFVCTAATGYADEFPQRMRLPVGSYWLSGGPGGPPSNGYVVLDSVDRGGGRSSFNMPAYCVDYRRHAPVFATNITAFSGNVRIQQFDHGKLIAEKPLVEAVAGPSAWVDITGNGEGISGSFRDILMTPRDKNYDYAINVEGLALAGSDAKDVGDLYDRWKSNTKLATISAAFDSFRAAIAGDRNYGDKLDSIEEERQQYEWLLFGEDQGGAIIPRDNDIDLATARAAIVDLLAGDDANLDPSTLTDKTRGDLLTLFLGAPPSPPQADKLARALSQFGLGLIMPSLPDTGDNRGLLRDVSRVINLDRNRDVSSLIANFNSAREQTLDFASSLRAAAFQRFSSSDSASGQIEFELLTDLNCASEFGDDDDDDDVESEKSAIRSLIPLREMATKLSFYSDEFRRERRIKVSSDGDEICLQWIESNGQVTTKTYPQKDFDKNIIAALGPAKFFTVGDDGELDDLLRSNGIVPLAIGPERLRAAAESLVIPAPKPGKRADFVVTSKRVKGADAPGADVSVLELPANGDAGVVKLPDGSLVLIDTGIDNTTVDRLGAFLGRNYGNPKPAIRLVITHSHQDHIGGLSAILAAGYRIDEIIIGVSTQDKRNPTVINGIRTKLKDMGYAEDSTESVSHFVRQGVTPWLKLSEPTLQSGSIETFVLRPAMDTTITLHHALDGNTPNDAGFVVKLRNKQTTWLLTDDMSASLMQSLLANLSPTDLSAGYMKWPHHLWFPSEDTGARRLLERFLRTVGAHTYVFSNKGHYSHTEDRYKTIASYLRATFDSPVNAFWTDDLQANLVLR